MSPIEGANDTDLEKNFNGKNTKTVSYDTVFGENLCCLGAGFCEMRSPNLILHEGC